MSKERHKKNARAEEMKSQMMEVVVQKRDETIASLNDTIKELVDCNRGQEELIAQERSVHDNVTRTIVQLRKDNPEVDKALAAHFSSEGKVTTPDNTPEPDQGEIGKNE